MWTDVSQPVWSQRELRALGGLLRLRDPNEAGGYLARLAGWALEQAPDGLLIGVSSSAVAHAAGWHGDPRAFVEALLRSSILKRETGELTIARWDAGVRREALERRGTPARIEVEAAAEELWQAALAELAHVVNRANFEAYLMDTVGLRRGDTWLMIGVTSEYVRVALALRFRATAERAIYEVGGKRLRARLVEIAPPATAEPG